jgi:putative restriction endonuclease
MGFGVFIHRSDSMYDDSPAERYQFPRQYEPRKIAETRGYFAIAKVGLVIPDPIIRDMHLAIIEPGTYLDFVNPVPFSNADGVVERGVLNDEGRISGRAQAAVRTISATDFNRIVSRGFEENELELPRRDELDLATAAPGFAEAGQSPFIFDYERERVIQFTSRIVRDRIFRRLVLQAYDKRCAITGLKLINGGGRAEVDAAHIKSVEANGPDILANGLALSGTAHWMFDRSLISLSDDLQILVSRQANDPESIRSFVNRTGRAMVPRLAVQRPHPHFLRWHRENCFKR